MIKFLFYTSIYFIVNQVFIKKNFLLDKIDISEHKKKNHNKYKNPPYWRVYFYYYISSPKIRIIFQIFCILFFVILDDLSIKTLSIEIIDGILEQKIINVLLLLFCLLVLVNGFNFLDGVNTLVIGSFIICLLSIHYLSSKNGLILNFAIIENLLIVFFVIYLFNFFGKSFLGDSGTYAISFIVGVIFINFAYDNYLVISPYFVACIFWYPAFENLFSIIRRVSSKNKPSKADNNHLHHYLYSFIKNKILLKSNLFVNTLTGVVINIYLTISAFFTILYFNHTKTLLLIIFVNSLVYLLLYFLLNKKNYNNV